MEFTTNRNWPKPADGEDGWGDEMRAMVDDLDAMHPSGAPPLAVRRRTLRFDRYYGAGFTTLPATTLGNSSATVATPIDPNAAPSAYAYLVDPESWWSPTYALDGADPQSTTAVTIPAGTALLLPPGVYYASVFAIVTPALDVSTQWVSCWLDQLEYDPAMDYAAVRYPANGAASTPWFYDGYYNPVLAGAPAGTPYPFFTAGQTARYNGAAWHSGAVLMNDSPEPRPFGLFAVQRSVTGTTAVQYVSLSLIQLSGEGW